MLYRVFDDTFARDLSISVVRQAIRNGEKVNEGIVYSALRTLEYDDDIATFLGYLRIAQRRRVSKNLLVGRCEGRDIGEDVEGHRDLMARVRAANYVKEIIGVKGSVEPIPEKNKRMWAVALGEMTDPEHDYYDFY
tara:strand:+ start:584 stop:991 length:408 start_codon:yes stop_codon:yes gene_type:complete